MNLALLHLIFYYFIPFPCFFKEVWDKFFSDNIYLVKNVSIPIGIVECGFLSNPEEEQLLQQEDYQDKLAWGIYTGIMDYFYN